MSTVDICWYPYDKSAYSFICAIVAIYGHKWYAKVCTMWKLNYFFLL